MKTDVTFPSNDLAVAGILFTPDERIDARLPAIVISHPGGGVKEQSPSVYAERLTREGFAALVFDAAYQGESEGEPRGLENPFQRAEDIKSAVTHLTTRDDIDPDRIGALGICASGGYVPYAAQTDHRVKAVATVSAGDMGSVIREGLGRAQDPAVLTALLDRAAAARTAEARGEAPETVAWIPDDAEDMPATGTRQFRETYEFYRTPRGYHPRAVQGWVLRSADQLAQYDSYAMIRLIAPPPLADDRGFRGGDRVLQPGSDRTGGRTQGTVRHRRRHAHRPVRQGRTRHSCRRQAHRLLRQAPGRMTSRHRDARARTGRQGER